MRCHRFGAFTLASFMLLTLSGCFDWTEDLKFDEKGAGKLSIVFDMGDLGMLEKIAAAAIKKNPVDKETMSKDLPAGVKLSEFREEKKDDRKIYYITYEFDDLNKLAQWKANDADDLIFKNMSLTKVNDVWAFTRTIKAKDKDQLENARKHLSRSKIIFKLTGPGKLVKEQSNPLRVENELTCVWEGNFPALLEGADGNGTVMKAQFDVRKGLPAGLVIGLVVVVVAVAAVGGLLMFKKNPAA